MAVKAVAVVADVRAVEEDVLTVLTARTVVEPGFSVAAVTVAATVVDTAATSSS